ncbi:MAG: YafY family transcriptional regulator [Candidatus Latescibacteria bacterium]|nr:YafY family transcriptional regulator [Candidatus Latescibacterota bacterium]
MSFSTHPPYRRMAEIDYLLAQRRYPNARKLAERFEVDVRTIYRDIDYMRDQMHAPIEFDRRRNGYYYTEEGFVLPVQRLTEGELVAIFLAERLLTQYSGTPYYAHLKSAFQKISDWLPEKVSVSLSLAAASFSFDRGPTRETQAEVFQTLSRAIDQRRTLSMTYFTQSRNRLTQRMIDPYHFLNHEGDWYLVAYCHRRKAVRDFAISRIRALEETDRFFSVPGDFDLQGYLRAGFGIEKGGKVADVTIWFDPYQARWIREKQWDESEQREEQADGSLILRMRIPVTGELKRWVLSYGSHAAVLEPEWLREEMREEAGKILGNYS